MGGWLFYAFLAALASMLAWLYCRERKLPKVWAKVALLLSLALYVLLLLLGSGGLWVVLRDLAVFALAAFLGFYFAESAKLFTLSLVALALVVKLVYFGFSWGTAAPVPVAGDSETKTEPSAVAVDPRGELLVDLRAGATSSQILEALQDHGATLSPAFPNLQHPEYSDLEEYWLVDVADEQAADLQAIIALISTTDAVDWVERNEVVQLSPIETVASETAARRVPEGFPNDPLSDRQWALGALDMTGFYREISEGKVQPRKRAKVAILDTGVDAGHEDLRGNYVSTDPAFDVDGLGHGTHCAGIAAAVTHNAVGIASIAADDRFLSVTSIKVLGAGGGGTQQTIIAGILRAADEGADVISMSLGGPSDDQGQRAYEEAVKYANRAGAIVVAAAGNNSGDARRHLPAGADGVIAVAALAEDLSPARFTNDVSGLAMGIAAPGVGIVSTLPGNRYEARSGTSMAAPFVAGLLGVMKALDPDLTTAEAFELLESSGLEPQSRSRTGRLIQPAKVLRGMGR